MSGGRNQSGDRANKGMLPTQKLGRHHSFASQTEDSTKPGSIGNAYNSGANVRGGVNKGQSKKGAGGAGEGGGTKSRPDLKKGASTPAVDRGAWADGNSRGGGKQRF